WSKLTAYPSAVAYMQAFGLPGELLPLAIAVELGGGLMILLGLYARVAALALAGFCIITAIVFHANFGNRNELLHFEKDVAIAGGFLILAARGAGAWALDRFRRAAAGEIVTIPS